MKLAELLKKTPSLPVTPEVLPKLIRIMKDPDNGAEEIMGVISTDPSIVAGVLKLANSSIYAPPSPVTDLNEAVTLLGNKEIYRIVSNVASSSFLDGELKSLEIGKGGLWTHSLAVAIVMETIAENESDFEGLPYTLGLLHDIGKLVLHHAYGECYNRVFQGVETENLSLNQAETALFGFDHALVGGEMLKEWGFPEEIYVPVRYRYTPENAGQFRKMSDALQIANWAAGVIGCNVGRDTWALDMENLTTDIDEIALHRGIIEAQERMQQAKQALSAGSN